MTARRSALILGIAGAAGFAEAQPATEFRLSNGTNAITVAPGTAVEVSVYATGLPAVGTPIIWTMYPGGLGYYAGFNSVLMDVNASGGGWSGLSVAAPFLGPPFGSPGTVVGASVNGVNISVGFNAPVTGREFLLWKGVLTVGGADVLLATAIQPVGQPPQTGFHVALGGIIPPYNVSQFMATSNGTATITVPGPGGVALLGLAGLVGARRRRR